jgi:thermostable 8-oxoguanine DNA glycosylase
MYFRGFYYRIHQDLDHNNTIKLHRNNAYNYKRMSYKNMNVERAPSFAIYSCTSNKREMRVKRKIVGLGFKEASTTFRV